MLAHSRDDHLGGAKHARRVELDKCISGAAGVAGEVNAGACSLEKLNEWLVKLRMGAKETVAEAKRELKAVHVNIFDLVREDAPRVFPTRWQLAKYTLKSGKIFPKERAKANDGEGLRMFLRKMY